jgi:hypothetical protein
LLAFAAYVAVGRVCQGAKVFCFFFSKKKAVLFSNFQPYLTSRPPRTLMDQLVVNSGPGTLYRRRRSVRLFGIRLGRRRDVLLTGVTILTSAFINYIFLWPTSHFWALMLLAVAISGALLTDLKRRTALIAAAAVFAAAGAVYAWVGPAVRTDLRPHAWLLPGHDATPPNACATAHGGHLPAGSGLALLGTTAILLPPGQATPILTIGACQTATLTQDSTGILLNATVHDEYGTPIFRIINNQLRLVDGRAAYAERSVDHTTATIYGENGNALLGVSRLNAQTTRISGVFACKSHDPVQIRDAVPTPGVPTSCLDAKPLQIQ